MSIRDYEFKIFERVNPLVSFSVRRYVLAIGIFVAIVAFGLVATFTLGVDLFPQINIPVVVVSTSYPGATPSVVDQQITQVLENAVSTVTGITDINSTSYTGMSRVVVLFDQSTDQNSDTNQIAAVVSAAVKALPSGVSPPVVQTVNPNSQPILQFGIYGRGANLGDIRDYVTNTLSPLLARVPGVANIQVDGGPARTFQVLLDPSKLHAYSLTPQQVVSAIASSAINQPIGTIVSHNNALAFATQNMPADVRRISAFLVDPSRSVTVGNVGVVRDLPVPTNYARINGIPAVLISIQQTPTSNQIAVVDGVRKLLDQTKLPAGYTLAYSNDTTGSIRASVQSTYRELFVTALVVAFIVLLFLGKLNTAFSVILAIPIALAAAPVLYALSGFTFNLISLLALIVAIGIVVDDSIVVSENVDRYRAMGFSLREAVLKGASEVFSAVVAATLSLLAVLLPVSFVGGFIGRYVQQFSLGLAAAVAFSLLEAVLFLTVRLAYTPEAKSLTWAETFRSFARLPAAIRWGLRAFRRPAGIVLALAILAVLIFTRRYTYLPALLAYPLALGLLNYLLFILYAFLATVTATLHAWTEAGLTWTRDRYAAGLHGVLRRSVWVLAGSGAFLVAVIVLVAPLIVFSFVPNSDAGSLDVHLRLAPGTPAIVTNTVTNRLERYLLARPEVKTIQTVVGSSGVFGGGVNQNQNASLVVQLSPVGTRAGVADLVPAYRKEMLALVRDHPSARLIVHAGGGFQGQGNAVQLSVVAADEQTLMDRNNALLSAIQTSPWVSDVVSSLSDVTLENDFIPDDQRLAGTGINPTTIGLALQYYTSGFQPGSAWIGGLSYPIEVQIDPIYLASGQSLLNLPIYSPTLKQNLQAGQLGSFVMTQAPVSLSRYNRLYTAQFNINLVKNAPPALAFQTDLSKDLTRMGLIGNGVELSSGSSFNAIALARQLATTGIITFLLAFFLAYLVMAAQFNSWRYPIYLLLPVPLAIVGALACVVLLGGGLDIFGILGMLLLIGLSAKNAILYLDFVVERLGKMPFVEALVESARLRFRPIVMTTLTVLVISGPLVFGHGEGAEFGQRLGVVMFGGIVFSAVLTFFVVPAAFYLFERNRPSAQYAPEAEAALSQDRPEEGAEGKSASE